MHGQLPDAPAVASFDTEQEALQMLNANCYFMEAGRIRTKGTLDELMAEEDLRRAYFGV